MSSILDQIFADKREELAAQRSVVSNVAIVAAAKRAPAPRDFIAALKGRRPAIIAEIKRASPSKGDILPGLDPAEVARAYERCGRGRDIGADRSPLQGHTRRFARGARSGRPCRCCARTSFFDPYQVYEARAAGADCILLIVAMLNEAKLRSLAALAQRIEDGRADRGAQSRGVRAGAENRRRTHRNQQSRPAHVRDRSRRHREVARGLSTATR